MARYPGFIGASYTGESRIADCERCVNWYPEQVQSPTAGTYGLMGSSGKNAYVLYPAPGYQVFCTLPTSPVRGLFTLNGVTYAVGGGSLYQLPLFAGGSPTLLGSGLANPDNGPVTFASNGDAGNQVFMTSGSRGYTYDVRAKTLTLSVDVAMAAGFVDGFFLALDPDNSTFRISALENGATSAWDPTQIAQRSIASDKWLAMLVSHREIWLFGSQVSEVWYNDGGSPFPFTPNPSVFLQYGIAAPWSAALVDNAPTWLGQTAWGGISAYRANGYAPQRISTHAVEYQWAQYPTVIDAQAWTYSEVGHSFYVLTFPTANATWVYDAATGLWHERGSYGAPDYGAVPVSGAVYAGGLVLVGDRVSGNIYEQSVNFPLDTNGQGLRQMRRAPHLHQEAARLLFDRFQLDLEVGIGAQTGQGVIPQIMLRWSDDGGQSWGNEHWTSGGAIGQYKTRAIWRQLGSGRDRVYEVATSDPIPWRVVDAYLTVRGEQTS